MKKASKKIAKILLLIAMIFSDLMTPISVLAEEVITANSVTPEKGDVRLNGVISDTGSVTVTEGTFTNEGDVQVTKTVSKTDTLGKYKVEFEIKGKDVTDSTEVVKPVYVVVVFDRSGSMKNTCTKYEENDNDNDGRPGGKPGHGNRECVEYDGKWDNAVSGAQTFASTLLGKISGAKIALVTFAYDAEIVNDDGSTFVTTDFTNSSNFGSPNGGTNLHAGLIKANELLNRSDVPTDAYKYVVVISDGKPTYYMNTGYNNDGEEYTYVDGDGSNTTKEILDATFGTADTLKSSTGTNAEVFSIGYSLPTGNICTSNSCQQIEEYKTITAEGVLTKVATTDSTEEGAVTHYINSDPEAIANSFTNIANEISRSSAGTNATLTDNIGGAFSIVGQEGSSYTSGVISKITEEATTENGQKISFYIDIDQNSPTGWYDTNAGFNLVYTDASGNSQTISSDNNPQVYWENVEFANESIEKTTINTDITSSNTIVNYNIKYNLDINYIEEDSTIVTTIIDTLPYEIDLEKSNLNGGVYDSTTKTITWTISENITSYTASKTISKEINYSVVYKNIADVSSLENNSLVNVANGQTSVSSKISTGVSDDATIPVNILGTLEVSYVDENGNLLTPVSVTTKPVGTEYATEQKTFYGYSFKEVSGNVTGKYIEGKTEVKYVYAKDSGDVTTNEVTKSGLEKVESINDTFEYTLTYKGKIENYVGETKLTLKDKLPFTVKEIKELDKRCTYDELTNTITCEETYEITNENREINDSFIVKVTYENVTGEVVKNEVTSELTYGTNKVEEKDETETKVEKGSLIVTHKLIGANGEVLEILEGPTTTTEIGGTKYTTSANNYYGCSLKEVIGNENGEYIANSTIYVEYIYTKNIGNSKETLEKVGPYEVDGVNSKFDYTITYETIIDDFIGEATLTIVDILPYEIDLEKSVFSDNCTYEDGKLICKYTQNIDENNKKINVEEKISIYYIEVDSNEVINEVESTLVYGETTKNDKNLFVTEVKEGKVNVNYVTIENGEYVELTDSIIINGLVETTYETEEKTFEKYTLKEIIGDTTGIFTLEDKEVTYVYELKEMPPKTGVEAPTNNGFGYINYIFMLLVGLLLGKRR